MTYPFATPAALQLQAATPLAGFPLQNGTPTILSWTAPADGRNHHIHVVVEVSVSSAETGGAITVNCTFPDGTANQPQTHAGSSAAGSVGASAIDRVIQSGSTVTITQAALSLGAAIAWAEIWGS